MHVGEMNVVKKRTFWLIPFERFIKRFRNLFYRVRLEKTILLIYKTLKLDENYTLL